MFRVDFRAYEYAKGYIEMTEDIIPKMQSLPQSAKDIIMSRENKVIDYTSQMLIINPDGRADSWVPSVSDVFAEDWEIVI